VSAKGLFHVVFTATGGTGAISVPGLKIGDVAMSYTDSRINVAGSVATCFEGVISVDDQVQQVSALVNGDTITAIFVRA
jgi:hypothetical protein